MSGLLIDACVNAIIRELKNYSVTSCSGPLASIFLGGGTPTYLSASHLTQLLSAIQAHFLFSKDIEFTVEANPESLTAEKVQILLDGGVNRISIGVQAIDKEILAFLNRPHSKKDAEKAIEIAKTGGFTNVNLDFIHSIPGLSLEKWEQTIEWALGFAPKHLSCYSLTFEPHTPLFESRERGAIREIPESAQILFLKSTREQLRDRGYDPYEVSNFAIKTYECKHNINYWKGGSYIGVGPGASSHFDGIRTSNIKEIEKYIEAIDRTGNAEDYAETLSPITRCKEAIWLSLRLKTGANLKSIKKITGVDPHPIVKARMGFALQNNLCYIQDGNLFLSEAAIPLTDYIAMNILG